MEYLISAGIKLAAAALLTVLLGNGSVVMFNRMPAKWFEDEGKLPEELRIRDFSDEGRRQRLPSTPWKYIFVALFGMCGVYLALRESLQYEISVMIVIFFVLEAAICDAKYMIVPDQLNILLAVSALGFIGFYDEWWEQLAGAAVGFSLILAVYGLGRLIYRKETIGGADLKFFTAIGLIGGREGAIVVFVLTELLIAVHALLLLVRNRDALKEHRPVLPYAAAAVIIYFLFLNDLLSVLKL